MKSRAEKLTVIILVIGAVGQFIMLMLWHKEYNPDVRHVFQKVFAALIALPALFLVPKPILKKKDNSNK